MSSKFLSLLIASTLLALNINAQVRFDIPDKLIESINKQINSTTKETFMPGTVPIYYLYKHKYEYESYQIFSGDKMIRSCTYDSLGRMIMNVSWRNGELRDSIIYSYNDKDQLMSIEKLKEKILILYPTDSMVVNTTIYQNSKESKIDTFLISENRITNIAPNYRKNGWYKYHNYLTEDGIRHKTIHLDSDGDTVSVSNFQFDANQNFIESDYTYKSDNWGDKRPSLFCDDRKEIIYNEVGFICRKLFYKNCGDDDWELFNYHYITEIELHEDFTKVTIGFEQNDVLYKTYYLEFNSHHDLIKKRINDHLKDTEKTISYVFSYRSD